MELKLQYFVHLIQRADSLEKTLMLGKIEGRRRREWQMMRWLDGITAQWTWVWASSGSWWWTGKPGVLQSMESQRLMSKLSKHDWTDWHNNSFMRCEGQFITLLDMCGGKGEIQLSSIDGSRPYNYSEEENVVLLFVLHKWLIISLNIQLIIN